jgi:excisionase family DNA binding protein
VQYYFRVREVAEMLGFSRTMTYQLVKDGMIGSVEINGVLRVPYDAIIAYLNEVERTLRPAKELADELCAAVLSGGDPVEAFERLAKDERLELLEVQRQERQKLLPQK